MVTSLVCWQGVWQYNKVNVLLEVFLVTVNSNIVSVSWLSQHIDDPEIVILDATMKKKPTGEDVNHPSVYIPGAREFNFDTEICDHAAILPHMLPTPEQFEVFAQKLGIDQNTLVVCYDAIGVFSAPRAWWMFKIMGHQRVVVVNGGLPAWQSLGLPVQDSISSANLIGDFKSEFLPDNVCCVEQVLDHIKQPSTQIIDARSSARFYGTEEEPRRNCRGGHIPGSSSLPFTELLENGQFRKKEELFLCFSRVIEEEKERLIFSCGSGVTACVLALAADEIKSELIENKKLSKTACLSVYDGSWSEWGTNTELPIND